MTLRELIDCSRGWALPELADELEIAERANGMVRLGLRSGGQAQATLPSETPADEAIYALLLRNSSEILWRMATRIVHRELLSKSEPAAPNLTLFDVSSSEGLIDLTPLPVRAKLCSDPETGEQQVWLDWAREWEGPQPGLVYDDRDHEEDAADVLTALLGDAGPTILSSVVVHAVQRAAGSVKKRSTGIDEAGTSLEETCHEI